jgi:cobalt-zinc-cadmium efflux system protein
LDDSIHEHDETEEQHPEHDHQHHHEGPCAHDAELMAAGRSQENRRRLWRVLILTSVYLVAEVVGGLMTNSLALLSDAGHMLTDVASLALALLAAWFATRSATPERTYGYHRLEILAALLNGLTLLLMSVVIVVEAIKRIEAPREVMGGGLLAVAVGGLIVNIIGTAWLHEGHGHSLNVRAAFYHMLGDLLGSIGAVVAGVLILAFGWYLADPILAVAIAVLIAVSAVGVIREAGRVLIEAAPEHLDTREIRAALLAVPGVTGVHDLHVWTITSGMYSLSCHCVVSEDALNSQTLDAIRSVLGERFGLAHHTVQLETCRGEWCPALHE